MKKIIIATIMLFFSTMAHAVLLIASPTEPCMWPWTRPDITVGSKWEAVRCTGGKNPYNQSCKTEIYHILDIKDGYAKYNRTYMNRDGKEMTLESSGSVKFISCSYTSFKKI